MTTVPLSFRAVRATQTVLTSPTALPKSVPGLAIPDMKNQEIPSMLSALRNRYIAETKGQAAYESASAITSNKKLAQIYIELASDEKLHAGEIERLIEKAMG